MIHDEKDKFISFQRKDVVEHKGNRRNFNGEPKVVGVDIVGDY